jgi:hypothetical protein
MDRHDILTVVAIGFTITVLSTLGHEAVGHGGACVLTGCDPVQVSTTYFAGNRVGLSDTAIRMISLGGTIFNFVLGLVFLALLRMIGPGVPARRYYVLWFGSMVNLVSASGYIFFGSAFAFGDYRTILEGAGWPLRGGCIFLGAVLYFGALWVAARNADPLLGSGPDRRSRLFALVLLPAISAGSILSASALLSPVPHVAIFSFIGHVFPAIGAWGLLQWFVGDGKGETARNIARSRAWWIAAAVVVLVVGAVGPGVPRATLAELESSTGG